MHFRRHFFRRCDTIRSERSAFYDFTKTQIFSFSVYSPADSFWYWDVGAFVFAGDETTVSVSGKQM